MALERSPSNPASDNLITLIQDCDNELARLIVHYNEVKHILSRFKESERMQWIRQFVIGPIAAIVVTATAISSGVLFWFANSATAEDTKTLLNRLTYCMVFAAILSYILQNLFVPAPEEFSLRWRTLTCKFTPDDNRQLERLLHSLNDLLKYLKKAYGENNQDMQLIYQELQRTHRLLSHRVHPVKKSMESVDEASVLLLQIQHVINNRSPGYTKQREYFYQGLYFHSTGTVDAPSSVRSDLEGDERTFLNPAAAHRV